MKKIKLDLLYVLSEDNGEVVEMVFRLLETDETTLDEFDPKTDSVKPITRRRALRAVSKSMLPSRLQHIPTHKGNQGELFLLRGDALPKGLQREQTTLLPAIIKTLDLDSVVL